MEFLIENGADVTIEERKGTDSIYFKGIENTDQLTFKKNERDLIIESTDAKVTITNYYTQDGLSTKSSVKTLKYDKTPTTPEVINLVKSGLVKSDIDFVPDKKGKIKGTKFADTIYGTGNKDNIYTNGGNDTIYSSQDDDILNLSKGKEHLIYTTDFGKDTVKNFLNGDTLKFTAFTKDDIDLYQNGNNLIFKNDDNEITLVNYFKSLTKNKVETTFTFKDGEEIDLMTANKAIISDYSLSAKGKTIKGSKLQDIVYGSDKNDKIYIYENSNITGHEYIQANKGNDKIYTGDGTVELKFQKGDGNDIIYLGNNEKSTYIFDFGMEERYYEPLVDKEIVKERFFAEIKFIKSQKNNDLKIVYSYDNGKTNDSVTIKNFYKDPKIADRIIINNYVTVNPTDDNKLSTLMTMGAIETYITGNGKLTGTDYGDFITGGKGKNKIYADSWTDYVYGKGGNDTIFLSNSLDSDISKDTNKKGIYFNTGDGADIIDTTGLEFGTISLYSRSTKLYEASNGDIIAGNMGDYTQNKIDTFYWNDIFDKTITYGKTLDISNSKMIFKDFLNIETDIKIENLGTGKIYDKEALRYDIGHYEELISNKIYNQNNPLIYDATDKDDYTISGKNYNIINCNDGDDIVLVQKNSSSKAIIDGGNGIDSVVAKNINAGAYIKNIENIQIDNLKKENLRLIFNVDKNSTKPYTENDAISIFNNSNISKSQNKNWIVSGDNKFIKTGIFVENNGISSNIYVADKKGLNSQEFDKETTLRTVGKNVQNYFATNSNYFGEEGINVDTYYDFINFNTTTLSSQDLKIYNKHKKALLNIYKTGLSKNDTITSAADEGYKHLEGQKGNDTYIIQENDFLNNKLSIYDSAGKQDTIYLENIDQENTNLYFDVTLKTNKKGAVIYKKGVAQYTNTGDLQILTDIDFTKNISENNGIKIIDYFKKGKIENIITNDKLYDLSSIKTLSSKIANWLAENNYTSTKEVFEKGTKSAIVELLLIYKNEETQIKAGNEAENILTNDDIIIADINESANTTPPLTDSETPTESENMKNAHRVNGYAGNDLIIADTIKKEIIINSGIGNDTICSGMGDNFIYADAGDDYIILNTEGDSSISGGSGNDSIVVENVGITTVINGESGNDTIDGKNAKYYSILNGGDGDDLIHSSVNIDSSCEIYGGNGNDTIWTYSNADYATDEVDNIVGKQKISMVTAGSGNDEIHTSKGQNHIYVESTTDTISIGNDNDIYYYGGGEDIIYFSQTDFTEFIFEQQNDDLIIHHKNDNKFTIKDFFTFNNPNIQMVDSDVNYGSYLVENCLKIGSAGITLNGTNNNDTIRINGKTEYTYNVEGYEGNDLIVGFEGHSKIYSGDGNDTIYSYSDIENAKNTTQNILVDIYGGNGDDVYYAQSSITRTIDLEGNDTINAYLDQNTLIYDYAGTNDQLNLIGAEASHNNINVILNVTAQGVNTYLMNDENLSKWKQAQNYNSIAIASNQIEKINSSDGYYVTTTQIAELAQDVAGWLTTKGYGSVAEVVQNEKTVGDIDALLAIFDSIEWQQTT